MDTAAAWQHLFSSWPKSRPKTGIVITTFQEPIPFTNFLLSEGILALERDRPDSQNARKVFVAFTAILAVKFTDTDDFLNFKQLGFC
ncbi:hypothetical protein [Planctomicrobium piriforme]|uniref:Uncharacterized protein n=1 Tax=Planctomicrobium piriforme TaxID=1576369 RepID=A0A1I3KUV5_9PLAN|nr:hypothetical protein [Planctomicrobium piriforme]SFI76299.1 hypothetical protein SAMN05421753_11252 [Planctomicrobium piriforme]